MFSSGSSHIHFKIQEVDFKAWKISYKSINSWFFVHQFVIMLKVFRKLNFDSNRISKILRRHDSEREKRQKKIDKKSGRKNCNQRQRDIWRTGAKEKNENHQTRIRSCHAEALYVTWCPKLIYFCSFSRSFFCSLTM